MSIIVSMATVFVVCYYLAGTMNLSPVKANTTVTNVTNPYIKITVPPTYHDSYPVCV